MKLSLSNKASSELVKLVPAKHNRVLFIKKIIFGAGAGELLNIILSVISINKKKDFKFLKKMPLGNYEDISANNEQGVLLNEQIVLPVGCSMIDFEIQSSSLFDLTVEFAVI